MVLAMASLVLGTMPVTYGARVVLAVKVRSRGWGWGVGMKEKLWVGMRT